MKQATNDAAGRFAAEAIGGVAAAIRFLESATGPFVDLFIRLWLGQIFFVSAILKLASWQTALTLARYEYPVSWLDPGLAAVLGVAVELLGSIMLIAGFATRFAAIPMLALSLVIQYEYLAVDTNLFWAMLFGWYALRGAGPISLDRALARGLRDSALPFARAASATFAALTRRGLPVYQLAIRLWLGFPVFAAWSGFHAPALLVPTTSAQHYATPLGLVLVAALTVGVATRLSALSLIATALAMAMMDIGQTPDAYWLMAFALIAVHGPGVYSVDALTAHLLRRRFPRLAGKSAFSLDGLPHVVIVGAGFGGLSCAAKLARTPVRITLIDRHNYHLFQPLLYQVATAGLAPGDIAMSVRSLFRTQHNARVLLGTVTGVDTARREVLLDTNKTVAYDYLVLATGAAHSYFGRDEWAPYAPGLKRIEDATEVRSRILAAFEHAETADSEEERRALLTFLIVGAGPTGVELAGAIAELAKFGMQKEFRSFDPAAARILLVQAAPRVLPTFPEALSRETQKSLERLGVEVMLDSVVQSIDDEGVIINGERVGSRTVLWAAGVVASPAARWVGGERDNAGRLKVGEDLSVAGLPDVFGIGDTVLANAWEGKPVPGLAPAAKQEGAYVAALIRSRIARGRATAPFRYRHVGSLATIGRKAAVADFGFISLRGAPAWWLWGAIHIGFLVGARNRFSIVLDWFWSYLTFRSGTRLITGTAGGSPKPAREGKDARWPLRVSPSP